MSSFIGKVRRAASRIKKHAAGNNTKGALERYFNRFEKYSFTDCQCETQEQFEASVTRLYHTIEKGLSYENYRA